MIFHDDYGLPTDETGDPGDSAVRISILSACGMQQGAYYDLETYEVEPGVWVRHPKHKTWSNPKNFTRDQMMMIIWALHQAGDYEAIRRMFWSRFKAFPWLLGLFSVAQSVERDVPGSIKTLHPHSNWKDSVPTPDTFKMKWNWRKFKFEPIINNVVGSGGVFYIAEHKLADGPDPLLPNHMGAMIVAGRIWPFYWSIPLVYVCHLLALYLHSKSDHYEENQIIAECTILGTLKTLDKWKPHWIENSFLYWADRNEIEYHDAIVAFVKMRI